MKRGERVRDVVPGESLRRTRAAGLPDPDWYAGRIEEPQPRMDPREIIVGGEEGMKERARCATEARREEIRRKIRGFFRRPMAETDLIEGEEAVVDTSRES